MKSYLSLIPISAKVHKRQNRMTIGCIVISVFLVTAVFTMTEMVVRQETARLVSKHGIEEVMYIFTSEAFLSLLPIAAVLFVFVLCAGVFMIAGSMNSNVAQRTHLFGMMRCIGMSKRQIIRYVRLEALNWCKSAVPIGVLSGTAASWILCAVLKYCVGGEWADIPQLKFSLAGIVCGAAVGVLTVLIAAGRPARRAAKVTPVSAVSGMAQEQKKLKRIKAAKNIKIEKVLGIRHATESVRTLGLLVGSFALSIILFLSFSVIIDLVNYIMPQSASAADIEIYAEEGTLIDSETLTVINEADGVEIAFGRRSVFDQEAECDSMEFANRVDIISFGEFDIKALKKDGILERNCNLDRVIKGNGALIVSSKAIPKGTIVNVFGTELDIEGSFKYDPFSSDGNFDGKTTLIVSDETFRNMTGISGYNLLLVRLSQSATDENVYALQSLIGDKYKWNDNREYDTHGTYVAFLVCVYSFLAVIALVTVLNIVNSISMSVSARIKQYGAMRAVGMSQKQLGRMIKAETLTYAFLGCLIGLVTGLILNKWLYGYLITSHYAYAIWHIPFTEIVVIGIFFVISFAAGIKSPLRRLNSMSITETIK